MKTRMTGTLTVRLPGAAVRYLRARARTLGISPSQLARAVLEEEIGIPKGEPSAFKQTERWIGAVRSPAIRGRDARRAVARWKPDRRG